MERITATYYIETPFAPEKAAAILADEQSSGTFVAVPGETEELKQRFAARVESVELLETVNEPAIPGATSKEGEYHRAFVKVSWSIENFGYNLPVIVSTLQGNLYEITQFTGLKLMEIDLPSSFGERYSGPAFGIDGCRKLTGVNDRPMIGTIIKPSVGLTVQQTVDIIKTLAEAGIDFIKDDELLSSSANSNFNGRVDAVMKVINEHADKIIIVFILFHLIQKIRQLVYGQKKLNTKSLNHGDTKTQSSTKKFFVTLCALCAFVVQSQAQNEVPQTVMEEIFEEIKTPYKYGLVITPENDSKKIDCPSVFKKGKDWYMTYILFDGRGYETWLARSKNLVEWKTIGRLMSFGDTTNKDATEWDANQKAGYTALEDLKWGGSYQLQKFNKKYWMSYIGGKEKGYEAGKLSIGMAHTENDPIKPHEWTRVSNTVLSATDKDVRWWENKKLYKSSVIWDKDKILGHPFVMYYNANGDTSNNTPKWRWFERIGMAVSDDMINWQRYQTDPVVHHKIGITGDGVIQKIGDVWVMFYFGAFWENRPKEAFNRFACSYDLVHWTDWNGEDLIKSTEDYDAKYAHKSYVVKWKGVVYHFYCAVDNKDHRGIAVATSIDKGKSKIHF